MVTPNTVIIRVPDQDGSKTFLNLPLNDEGFVIGSEAFEFRVADGDSYNLLEFNQVVFAISTDEGVSSLELARVTIEVEDGELEAPVAYEDPVQVVHFAKHIFDKFADGSIFTEGQTLQ